MFARDGEMTTRKSRGVDDDDDDDEDEKREQKRGKIVGKRQ